MTYRLTITPRAQKALEGLPARDQRRLDQRILALTDDPRPRGSVKLEHETPLWRIRSGEYRAIYSIDDVDHVVTIVHIAHCRDVYRGL